MSRDRGRDRGRDRSRSRDRDRGGDRGGDRSEKAAKYEGAPGCKVFVGGLDDRTSKEQLEDFFRKHGKIDAVWIARNPPGFGFITFADARDAKDACDDLDGRELLGKAIKVEVASGRAKTTKGVSGNCFNCGESGHFARDCPDGGSRGGGRDGGGRGRSPPRGGYDRGRGRSRSRSYSPRRSRSRSYGHRDTGRDNREPARRPPSRRSYSPRRSN